MIKIKPIVRAEVHGYCHFEEFMRMLKFKNDEAIHLCEKYGVMPKSIRVGIMPHRIGDDIYAVIEFCVPGALYESQKKIEAGETKEE